MPSTKWPFAQQASLDQISIRSYQDLASHPIQEHLVAHGETLRHGLDRTTALTVNDATSTNELKVDVHDDDHRLGAKVSLQIGSDSLRVLSPIVKPDILGVASALEGFRSDAQRYATEVLGRPCIATARVIAYRPGIGQPAQRPHFDTSALTFLTRDAQDDRLGIESTPDRYFFPTHPNNTVIMFAGAKLRRHAGGEHIPPIKHKVRPIDSLRTVATVFIT